MKQEAVPSCTYFSNYSCHFVQQPLEQMNKYKYTTQAKAVKFSLRLDTHLLKRILWSFRHLRHISTVLPSQPRPFKVFYSSSIAWSFRHLRHISTALPSQPRVKYQTNWPIRRQHLIQNCPPSQPRPFKVLYPSSISWPLRPIHRTNQKTARNAQGTAYSSIWQQQYMVMPSTQKLYALTMHTLFLSGRHDHIYTTTTIGSYLGIPSCLLIGQIEWSKLPSYTA